MKKFITAAIAFGGAIMISQSAFSQNTFVGGTLYLGFQNDAASADYIVNLGSLSGMLGQSTVVNVSSDFSMSDFNSVNNISGTTLAAAVGAANNVNDSFGTVMRTSNVGNPKVAGSIAPTTLEHYSQDSTVFADLSSIPVPSTVGAGTLDSTKNWSSKVSPVNVTGNFYSATGFNPNSTVTTSSVLYEDLYLSTDTDSSNPRTDPGQPYVYQGYFTIDFTGASPKVTFSSTNVPPTVTLGNPIIVSVTKTAGTVTVVSSNATATHSYQLQYAASLTAPVAWSNAGSAVIASATTVTNNDTSATAQQRFYRVQAQ